MKYIDEYRDRTLATKLIDSIKSVTDGIYSPVTLMEICGTHTVAISKYGIRQLLPKNIRIISGPGCPVCVTPLGEIDAALELSSIDNVILTTFGDMLHVPGTSGSLEELRATGRDIRIVYSSLDSLKIAADNPHKQVIFLGVGFETTAPGSARTIHRAHQMKLENFSLLCLHKLVPPALKALLSLDENRINGFICPGHVSVIIGAHVYELLTRAGKAAVVTGFEPLDILEGLWLLLKQIEAGTPKVDIQYSRVVTWSGNTYAQKEMERVFEPCDVSWRGLGKIPESGLKIRDPFAFYDAARRFKVKAVHKNDPPGCCCGEILRGMKTPHDCPLFGKKCTPAEPVGPCMVSNEGACAAYYRYAS
ncbi:MAG: hydrogenase formation protein HypD [bacterium]